MISKLIAVRIRSGIEAVDHLPKWAIGKCSVSAEYTINQRDDQVGESIHFEDRDRIGIHCYQGEGGYHITIGAAFLRFCGGH